MPPAARRPSAASGRRARPSGEPSADIDARLARQAAREAAAAERTLADVERREVLRQAQSARARSRLRFLGLVVTLVLTAVFVALVMFRAMTLILG